MSAIPHFDMSSRLHAKHCDGFVESDLISAVLKHRELLFNAKELLTFWHQGFVFIPLEIQHNGTNWRFIVQVGQEVITIKDSFDGADHTGFVWLTTRPNGVYQWHVVHDKSQRFNAGFALHILMWLVYRCQIPVAVTA